MGPRFRACVGSVGLATVVLVGCGGKVLEDSGSITIDGPGSGVGSSSGRSGSSGSAIDNGGDDGGRGYPYTPPPPTDDPPPRADGGAASSESVIAYASPGPQGLATKDDVRAAYDRQGRLTGFDAFDPLPPDPTAGAQKWWAWGSPTLNGSRLYYAIGQQVPGGIVDFGPSSANFALRDGGAVASPGVTGWEISASCVFTGAKQSTCKIQVNLHRGPGKSAQFVPAANVEGVHITADDFSTKSRLRGAFTCAESCPRGGYAGYGMVIAFEVEDPEKHDMLYGAAALSFFDPK